MTNKTAAKSSMAMIRFFILSTTFPYIYFVEFLKEYSGDFV